MESSWTRDQTCVPWIGRQILIHYATRKSCILILKDWSVFLKADYNTQELGECSCDNLPIMIWYLIVFRQYFPGGSVGKESTCKFRRWRRCEFSTWVGKSPWKRAWQPTPVFLPRESHGQRSLAGCSPRGHKESDTTEVTERTHTPDSDFFTSLFVFSVWDIIVYLVGHPYTLVSASWNETPLWMYVCVICCWYHFCVLRRYQKNKT